MGPQPSVFIGFMGGEGPAYGRGEVVGGVDSRYRLDIGTTSWWRSSYHTINRYSPTLTAWTLDTGSGVWGGETLTWTQSRHTGENI